MRWLSQRITRRLDRHANRSSEASSEAAKHRHALTQVLSWSTVVVAYCVAGIMILVRFGVPSAQLAAPAVVVGAALDFGGQSIVRDVLAGFFMVAERQYGVGDVVRLEIAGTAGKTVTGTVKDVTLRVTELRTSDGEVVITPNGEIIQVTNLSRDWARSVSTSRCRARSMWPGQPPSCRRPAKRPTRTPGCRHCCSTSLR